MSKLAQFFKSLSCCKGKCNDTEKVSDHVPQGRGLTQQQQDVLEHLRSSFNFKGMTEAKMLEALTSILRKLNDSKIPLYEYLQIRSKEPNMLEVATEMRYRAVVKALFQNGADFDMVDKSRFNKRDLSLFYNLVLSEVLNEKIGVSSDIKTKELLIREDDCMDATLKEYYLSTLELTYTFSVLKGSRTIEIDENGNGIEGFDCQTEQLAKLVRNDLITADMLKHPFIQVFIHYKFKKFRLLLQLTMIFQILWSAVCVVFIFCNSHLQQSTNVENTSRTSNLAVLCEPLLIQHQDSLRLRFPAFLLLILLLLFGSIAKEILELRSCWPNWKYYLMQLSNLGEWTVHFAIGVVLIMATLPSLMGIHDATEYIRFMEEKHFSLWFWFLPGIYMAGIFAALLLIQGQLNKTETLGIYIAMFTSGFINIMKFLLAFLPFLLGFMIIFHILQPTRSQFLPSWGLGFAKLLAMMTGEIDSDGMFYGDDEDQIAFKNILKLTMIVFTITVVILLQNLLVGLSVSDVQKLESDARVAYLVGMLENIYLIESVIFYMHPWAVKMLSHLKIKVSKKWIIHRFTVGRSDLQSSGNGDANREQYKKLDEYPPELREVLKSWIEQNKHVIKTVDPGQTEC